jgi:hypothetical protein
VLLAQCFILPTTLRFSVEGWRFILHLFLYRETRMFRESLIGGAACFLALQGWPLLTLVRGG